LAENVNESDSRNQTLSANEMNYSISNEGLKHVIQIMQTIEPITTNDAGAKMKIKNQVDSLTHPAELCLLVFMCHDAYEFRIDEDYSPEQFYYAKVEARHRLLGMKGAVRDYYVRGLVNRFESAAMDSLEIEQELSSDTQNLR